MGTFWNMGGYAFFVWGSFGAAFAVFLWNLVAPRLRRNEVRRLLKSVNGGRS